MLQTVRRCRRWASAPGATRLVFIFHHDHLEPCQKFLVITRLGKSCQSSWSGKLRALQCLQNIGIRVKGWTEICVSNVGVAWSNPQILRAYPQSIALHPQFWFLNPPFAILLPQIFLPTSILSKKYEIFGSKTPQNNMISDKMSTSAACRFFQVW